MSLRTKTLLLFLTFVLFPLAAVGVVSSIGTRLAVEHAVRASVEASSSAMPAERERDVGPVDSRSREAVSEPAAEQMGAEPLVAASPELVSTDEILAPLRPVRLAYLAVVLLVGAAATVGFRLVSHRIFSSLEEFRKAVEQIAQGDFTPWLPPPGTDEVGWLSLSLGRMAEAMGQMMRSVEQGGRLAVVGEMAAHMAHEVRTPLSSIKMNLQLLERSTESGGVAADARVSIATSLREIARLETTVTRILEFGAPEPFARQRCSLHHLISESAELLRGTLERANVEIHLGLAAESDWIWADSGRVKGVFLNLLVNALDEMPRGGEVSVETQLFLGGGGRQMVAAAVSDSGPGVPTALRDEIFNPFFTTKPDGSGIGLPAALKTLRDHGGDLYLSERPNGRPGGCFVVLLPLAPPSWSEVADEPERVRPSTGEWEWTMPSLTELRWTRVSTGGTGPIHASGLSGAAHLDHRPVAKS